jgi:hypothetical protein
MKSRIWITAKEQVMIKQIVGIVILSLAGGALAETMGPCSAPDPVKLRSAWKAFRTASLEATSQEIAKFYRFPVKLLSPFDGVPPTKLVQKKFLKDYSQIFQKNLDGENSSLQNVLLKTSEKEYISVPPFDSEKCKFVTTTRIADYRWGFDKKKGWLVESVYLGGEYETVDSLIKNN